MPIFNYKAKEIIVKIVYYGPGLGGKTTSIQCLHQQTIPERKGELYFLATETDQTIYFELLPLYVGEVKHFKLRFQVYTVPGQVKYNNTRKAVLQGVDAIVFVADSQRTRKEANLTSFKNLIYNLKGGYNMRLEDLPLVYEYNKRDMADILPVEELNKDLNWWNREYFKTVAIRGDGVLEAFEAISSLAINSVEKRLAQSDVKEHPLAALRREQQKKMQAISQRKALREREKKTRLTHDKRMKSREMTIANRARDIAKEPEEAILPKGEKEQLTYADIVSETYQDGDVIFNEGDSGDTMYFIEDGRVKIVGTTGKVLTIYEKGDFFGEMVLFGGKPRSARAIAIGTTHLIPVKKETLATQIQSKPEIALALLATLSNRIRNNTQTLNRFADENRDLTRRLNKSQSTIKRLTEENKALREELGI